MGSDRGESMPHQDDIKVNIPFGSLGLNKYIKGPKYKISFRSQFSVEIENCFMSAELLHVKRDEITFNWPIQDLQYLRFDMNGPFEAGE